MNQTHVGVLVGQTLIDVRVSEHSDQILFFTNTGKLYRMHHQQSCCENVNIDDICGDLTDLIGVPILVAEEITNKDDIFLGVHGNTLLKAKFLQGSKLPIEDPERYRPDSETWTFYKFRTIKGSVDIRWYGTSNGYYSETVDFELIELPTGGENETSNET